MIRMKDGVMDGVMMPADDVTVNRIKKLPYGEICPMEVKEPQNLAFHRKLFKLIGFAFDHMKLDDTPHQRKRFRKDLTILAGYHYKVYNYKGELRLEAQSLSFGKMSADERREFYDAILKVIWEKIFNTDDLNVLTELNRF